MEPGSRTPKASTFTDQARQLAQKFLRICQKVLKTIGKGLKSFGAFLKRCWKKFLRRFTKWIDPKLEPYRAHLRANPLPITDPDELKAPTFQPAEKPFNQDANQQYANPLDDAPKNRADIFEILAQAPHSIFSQRERNMITNLLSLPDVKVSSLMLPASEIVYVDADEVLGPLTLDRLYRSGLSHFPVKNAKGDLIGCVHTTHFNNLDIRESNRVSEILDPGLYYVREDYSLEQTLNTFLRTNAFFLLVTDRYGKVAGLVTFNDLMRHLFGADQKDTFDRDADRLAVASRRE